MSNISNFVIVSRKSVNFVSLTFAALSLLSACGEPVPEEAGEETNEISAKALLEQPVAEAESSGDPERPYWRLESDGTVYEGRLSVFFALDGDPMIQFVNRDAVNLGLAFDSEMSGVRTVTTATFAVARRPACQRVGEIDAFQISFEPADEGWLTGSFSGMLGCPDYSLMLVNGSFHIRAPGARQ